MATANKKTEKRVRLKAKIRAKVSGTPERPRLSVYRSNQHMYAQIIDDTTSTTLAHASDASVKTGTKTDKAKKVGELVAAAGKAKNITKVIFDRNGFKYTGRIKLLADAARASGLDF